MCKTSGIAAKRPAAFANFNSNAAGVPLNNASASSSSAACAFQSVSSNQAHSPQPHFFPNFFNPATFFPFPANTGALAQLTELNKDASVSLPAAAALPTGGANSLYLSPQINQFPNNFPGLNLSSAAPWYHQPSAQQVAFSPAQASTLQAQMEFLGRAAAVNNALMPSNLSAQPINNRLMACAVPMMTASADVSSINHGLPGDTSTPNVQPPKKLLKRSIPEIISDSNSEHSSDSERNTQASKKSRPTKRKHEATLDGERRVAIEFESLGSIGLHPQTYGKGALIVPDGVCGKYSAFGQRWMFTITHSVGPVICEDGVHRMCLSWSITNVNSGITHTVLETPADAMKRDRDGKTLCNRVFRDALSLRASALEAELRRTEDPATCVDLQSQLRTIQTKRFSEGPLFFGLRHCSLQQELRKELEARRNQISSSQ